MGASHDSRTAPRAGHNTAKPALARVDPQTGRAARGRLDASTLLELQASAGNQAVGLLLQRATAATADAGVKADAGTGSAYMEGKAADDLIDAFLKTLPGASGAVRNPAEGHVLVQDAATFKAALLSYAQGRKKDDKAFDPEAEARQGLSVGAFEDANQTIHIREGQGEFTTTLHEAFHLRESDKFKNTLGFSASEGATEFLTRMLCGQRIPRGEHYQQEREAVEALLAPVGQEAVVKAYFTGDIGAINQPLWRMTPGASTGQKAKSLLYVWVDYMKAGDFERAQKLFKGEEKSKP
jgi:hypothetical protein